MINLKLALIFVVSCIMISSSHSAKILTVFSMPSPSHFILGSAYVRGLLDHGHNVTMISPFSMKNAPKNGMYREIVLSGAEEHQKVVLKHAHAKSTNYLELMRESVPMLMNATESTLTNPEVQKLIHSGETFDVVVICVLMNDALKALAPHFNAHLISFSTIGPNHMVNAVSGNPYPPSYCPDMLLGYSSHMTFFQRLANTLLQNVMRIMTEVAMQPLHKALVEKYFPNAPPYDDLRFNASLVLLNNHESMNPPTPSVPHMINIGGFHIQKPKKLPEDFQKFLDEAEEGVIYCSMGSNVKSVDLSVEIRDAFLKSFGKTKLKVLWKWEDDVLPGQPDNVKLGKWMPQQDILAHKNVKLFITHGGLLSTTEAIHYGVPLLAIPFFGDQKMNAASIIAAGFGLMIPKDEVTEERLSWTLNEILTNPKYAEVAQTKSKIIHDRQNSPLETAVYWTEYVIRHNGAKHLRVAAIDLHWYQYYLVDVALFLLAWLLVSILITRAIYKAIKNFIIKKFSNKVKQN